METKTKEIIEKMHEEYTKVKKDDSDLDSYGGKDIPMVTPEEAQQAADNYFQAIILKKMGWIPMADKPGYYSQSVICKLSCIPKDTHVTTEILLNEKDPPEIVKEYEDYIESIGISGQSIIFEANQKPNYSFVIGIALVSDVTGEKITPSDQYILKEEQQA